MATTINSTIRPGKVDSLFLISLPLVVKVAALTFINCSKALTHPLIS